MISIQDITLNEGKVTKKVILKNEIMTVELLTYGAHLYRLFTKNRDGKSENIVLNITPIEALTTDLQYFGATIGPVAGRIAKGRLGDLELEQNENGNCLHSGSNGWQWQEWVIDEMYENEKDLGVVFFLRDTISGFSNEVNIWLQINVCGNELRFTYRGESNESTVFNPTTHAYFNLAGVDKLQSISRHKLSVASNHIVETDQDLIPTGKQVRVDGTPYDFRTTKYIGEALSELEKGLDTPFILNEETTQLVLEDEESGRVLSISSNRGAVVLYILNKDNPGILIENQKLTKHSGIAIELQEEPNIQPEMSLWHTIELLPERTVEKYISYHLSTKD